MIEIKNHPLMDLEEVTSIISDSLREGKMDFLPRRVSAEVEAADNSIEVTFCRPWYLQVKPVGGVEHLVTKVKIVFNLDKRNKGGKKVPYLSATLEGVQLCGEVIPLAELSLPYKKESISTLIETIAWHFSVSGDMMGRIVDYYDLYGLRYNEVIIKVNDVKYLFQRLLHFLVVKRIVSIPLIEYSKKTPENITEIFTYNKGDCLLPSQAKLSVEFKNEGSTIHFHIKKQLESASRVEVGSIAVEPHLDTMEDVAELILQHHQAE